MWGLRLPGLHSQFQSTWYIIIDTKHPPMAKRRNTKAKHFNTQNIPVSPLTTAHQSSTKPKRTTPTSTKIPNWFQTTPGNNNNNNNNNNSNPNSNNSKSTAQLTQSGIAALEALKRKQFEGTLDTLQTQSFRLNCTLRSQLHAVRTLSGKHVGKTHAVRRLSPEQLQKRKQVVRNTMARIKKNSFFTNLMPYFRDKGPKIFACDRVNLYVLKDTVLSTSTASSVDQIHIPWEQDLVGSVAAAGKLCNLASASEDSRFEGIYDQCTGYVTSSICCAVCSDDFGRTKAVLELLNKKLGRFDAGDEKIAQQICAAMSMYLK
jgi:putative methionine-R-sulfoxide reductase with GAF domain